MDDKRLDRIEQKLDKLTDAITMIARVEEKLVANNQRVEKLEDRLIRNETDLNNIAILARKNSTVAAFADKAFWLIAATILSIAAYFMKGE